MPSAQERAKTLAKEMMKALKESKTAEARARQLSKEVEQALAEARAEAESALTIIEFPSGRYECKSCGHSTLFTEPTQNLPACDNCGHREYVGAEPKITKKKPPPPKKFPAGMYECASCGARVAVVEGSDALSPCDLCGHEKLRAL